MKNLLLLFMLFGLAASFGDDHDNIPPVNNTVPAIELPETAEEPVISESQVSEPEEDPLMELEEYGTYKADIKTSDILWESAKQPLYVDNWALYSLSYKDAADMAKYTLYSKDLKTKEEKSVVEVTLDYDAPNVYYIHSANAGGYIAMGSRWDGEAFDYCFMSFDDDGNLLKTKSVNEIYKLPQGSYFMGYPVSDGTYIYASYQNGASGGVLMFDTEFNFLKQLVDSPNAYTRVGKDGFTYLLDGYHLKLTAYNPDNNEFSEAIDLPDYSYCLFNGRDGELLFGDSAIYSYNYRVGDFTELFSLEDFGIDYDLLYDIDFMYRDINGDIIVIYEMFKDENYTSVEAYEARFSLE